MKRWVRRVAMVGSIGLVVVAASLWIRGQFAEDRLNIRKTEIRNRRHAVVMFGWSAIDDRHPFHLAGPPFGDLGDLSPRLYGDPSDGDPRAPVSFLYGPNQVQYVVVLPYWLLAAMGLTYPVVAWLRQRRRTAAGGFPVEAEMKGKKLSTDKHG